MPHKPNILIVDDEVAILDGLKRALRKQRDRWNLYYAVGGREAQAKLAQLKIDVLVTDMRMPEFGGVDLLEHALSEYPDMVRLILSGQTDPDDVLRATLLAHRFVGKPVDPAQLVAVIDDIFFLREYVERCDLMAVAHAVHDLPIFPGDIKALFNLNQNGQVQGEDLLAFVLSDPLLSAKILHVAQSTFLGVNRPLQSIAEAINVLGEECVLNLLGPTRLFKPYHNALEREFFVSLVKKSRALSHLSYAIAQAEHHDEHFAQAVKLAGLFSRIGLILLANHDAGKWREAYAQRDVEAGVGAAVSAHFQLPHQCLAGYLLNLWGMDRLVIEAVVHRSQRLENLAELSQIAQVITLANVIIATAASGEQPTIPSSWPFTQGFDDYQAYYQQQGMGHG